MAKQDTIVKVLPNVADVVDVTLSVDTAALAAGDVASDTVEIANALRTAGGRGFLESIHLLDEADQGSELDLIFFNTNVSLGTKNSAPSISAVNARSIIGRVNVATGDYVDLGSAKIATVRNLGLALRAAAGTRSLWVSAIARGTPTYSAATAIKLKLGFSLS